jgi:hypothetical protein
MCSREKLGNVPLSWGLPPGYNAEIRGAVLENSTIFWHPIVVEALWWARFL